MFFQEILIGEHFEVTYIIFITNFCIFSVLQTTKSERNNVRGRHSNKILVNAGSSSNLFQEILIEQTLKINKVTHITIIKPNALKVDGVIKKVVH